MPINSTRPREIISVDDIGKIDINFPEFCFGIIGKTKVADQPESITYQLKNNPDNKITIIRSGMGFPDQTTRDILHALFRLTLKRNRFQSHIVPATLSDIFQELGWSKNGKSNLILKRHLNILLTTGITFESSYFDKYEKNFQSTLSFGILSHFWFREIKSDGTFSLPESGLDFSLSKGYFAWNEKFFEQSMKNSKNLINFDYTFYLSLETDIAKQLYLFLSKRKYSSEILRMPLEELAFTVLGISAGMNDKLYKVRHLLRKAHLQLLKQGFLNIEPRFEKGHDRAEFVVYEFGSVEIDSFSGDNSASDIVANEQFEIKKILLQVGATEGQVANLYKKYPADKLLEICNQIQMQYGETNKIRNVVGLVTGFMKQNWETNAGKEALSKIQKLQEKLEEKVLEEVPTQESYSEKQNRLEKERLEKSAQTDHWIVENTVEYMEMCQVILERRVKPDLMLKMYLEIEMTKSGCSEIKALTTNPTLKSLLREEIEKVIFIPKVGIQQVEQVSTNIKFVQL